MKGRLEDGFEIELRSDLQFETTLYFSFQSIPSKFLLNTQIEE